MDSYIIFIEYIGIIAFAISGALSGIKNRYDLLGVIILGVLTATGGGVIRDIILGINPPNSLRTGIYIYLAIIVSVIVFLINLFDDNVNRWTINKLFDKPLVVTDAIGLSVFVITGMQIAYTINTNYSMILYIFVGVVSGVGGGVLRDLITNDVPFIFDRHVYASAAIIGAVIFHISVLYTNLNNKIMMLVCMAIVFVIRMLAYKHKWNLPKATKVIK